MAEQKFPSEVIDLPSEGKLYPEGHPCKDGKIEIKYMTAKEEDILTSANLIKKGLVIDRLLSSLVVTKGVNLDGVEKMVKKAARISDQIFGLEKRVVKRGAATKKECDKGRELNAELKDCLKHVLGSETNSRLGYMPMHIREITKRKEKWK